MHDSGAIRELFSNKWHLLNVWKQASLVWQTTCINEMCGFGKVSQDYALEEFWVHRIPLSLTWINNEREIKKHVLQINIENYKEVQRKS